MTICLNSLPTVVDGPGEYITRNGNRVVVTHITKHHDPETVSFRVKGDIIHPPVKGGIKTEIRLYNIWHISGRMYPIHESPHDIVGKWPA